MVGCGSAFETDFSQENERAGGVLGLVGRSLPAGLSGGGGRSRRRSLVAQQVRRLAWWQRLLGDKAALLEGVFSPGKSLELFPWQALQHQTTHPCGLRVRA